MSNFATSKCIWNSAYKLKKKNNKITIRKRQLYQLEINPIKVFICEWNVYTPMMSVHTSMCEFIWSFLCFITFAGAIIDSTSISNA